MANFIDITGQIFSQWTVLKWVKSKGTCGQVWLRICSCGVTKEVLGRTLKKGLSKSCGCTAKDWCRTHMMGKTPEYYAWAAMLQRCSNTKNKFYDRYGGRGIKVCEAWKSFDAFYADMGARPDGMSLDRIDNNGNYEPSNCRWATQKEQLANREITKTLEVDGRKTALSKLAENAGLSRKVVNARINAGWSTEDALNKPMRKEMTHCKHGHEYTEANTHIDKLGAKVCKECKRLKTAEYRLRKANALIV